MVVRPAPRVWAAPLGSPRRPRLHPRAWGRGCPRWRAGPLGGAGATHMEVEEDGTGAVEADAGAGLASLVSSAYLVSPPVAGFSGEGGAPSMTPAERAARGTRAGPTKHPKGRKATAQYVGMLCAGCSSPFVAGDTPPQVEGGHMVHARLTCMMALSTREAAQAAVVAAAPAMHSLAGDVGKQLPHRPPGSDRASKPSTLQAAAQAATGFAGGSSTGPLLLRTRMAETVNGARMQRIRGCLDGQCDPSQCRFAKTPCSTCSRGLHVAECGQFGTARAALGVLVCAYCRAREMGGTREITESLMRTGMENMVFALTSGQETTAQATADLNQLESDFMFMKGLGVEEMMMPRHNRERFMGFLTWCFLEAHRGQSMTSLWRHMPVIFGAWKLVDFTQDKEVQRHFKRLSQDSGVEKTGRASCTDEQFRALLSGVLPREVTPGFYLARDSIGYAIEGLNGNRLTELYDGGQGHGVSLTDVTLVEGVSSPAHPGLSSFLDYYLASSKTHHPRYAGMVGRTRSGIDVAGMLRRYWDALGCPLVTKQVGSLTYTRGDRWVVRISLLGYTSDLLVRLLELLRGTSNHSARANVGATKFYAEARLGATGPGSEIRKFVNVACGGKESEDLWRLAREVSQFHAMNAPGLNQDGRVQRRAGAVHGRHVRAEAVPHASERGRGHG